MGNNRKHQRHPMVVRIKISHTDIGEKIVKTRDISDGGLFILAEPSAMPDIGSVIQGQVQGMADNPPILDMEVMRVDTGGLGLRYLLGDEPDDKA